MSLFKLGVHTQGEALHNLLTLGPSTRESAQVLEGEDKNNKCAVFPRSRSSSSGISHLFICQTPSILSDPNFPDPG